MHSSRCFGWDAFICMSALSTAAHPPSGFGSACCWASVSKTNILRHFSRLVFSALLLTPERRYFAGKWIWLGGLIALAIALPNILWQARHHWPTYKIRSNIAHSNKNVALTPAQFIAEQVVFMNPGTLPLWIAGLFWLFGSRDGRRYRAIGIIYLVTLAEFIVLHGKSYYLAPAYPML